MNGFVARRILVAGFGAVLLAVSGCQDTAGSAVGTAPVQPLETVEQSTTVAPATSTTTAQPTTSTTAESPGKVDPPPAQQWTMPNLVGANLQQAQDQIQALTGDAVFFTFSHDATGKDRHQILDRDWKVCAQNVPPGASITVTSRIDFGVVKLAERCP